MAEFQLVHRPAIGAAPVPCSDAFAMKALPEGTAIQVLGKPEGEDLTGLLRELAGAGTSVRTAGPGQWFLVRDEPTSHADLHALLIRLAPHAFGVDQSHGRVRIEISGSAVTRVLAKGTAIDFEGMVTCQSVITLIGHISVHMTRIAPDRFELMALRGFAESLWEDLAHMGAEFH